MIEIGADKPPQSWANAAEHRAQIARYLGRVGDEIEGGFKVIYAGTITTTASAAFTLTSVPGVESTDIALVSPTGSTSAAMAGVYASTSTDSVNLVHPSQIPTGNFAVIVVRP